MPSSPLERCQRHSVFRLSMSTEMISLNFEVKRSKWGHMWSNKHFGRHFLTCLQNAWAYFDEFNHNYSLPDPHDLLTFSRLWFKDQCHNIFQKYTVWWRDTDCQFAIQHHLSFILARVLLDFFYHNCIAQLSPAWCRFGTNWYLIDWLSGWLVGWLLTDWLIQRQHGGGSRLPAVLLQAVGLHEWQRLAGTTDDWTIACHCLSKHRLPSSWHQESATGLVTAGCRREIHRWCRGRWKNPNDVCWTTEPWHGSRFYLSWHMYLLRSSRSLVFFCCLY